MFPKIMCLHNTQNAPSAFSDAKWEESDLTYTCEFRLDNVEGEAVQQILIFTEGAWSDEFSDGEINIYLNGDSKKFCSLTKFKRCFLWSKENNQDGDAVLTGGENKIRLTALVQGIPHQTLTKDLQFSPSSNLTEGDIMQKCNETSPEVIGVSTQRTVRTKMHFEEKESSLLKDTPVKQSKKEKTPLSGGQKSKKRKLEKENSVIITPKLKAMRGKRGSRVFGHEKTPPVKRVLVSKTENDPTSTVVMTEPKVRCIQLSSRIPTPSSRWGHSMCMVDDKNAVLIGGQGNKMQLSKDSIWSLDTECRVWKSVDVETVGVKPECRTGHSATYDPTMRCIYVFGGSKNSKWFHDVHMYDLDEKKWTLVKANGKAPTRAYHSATLYRHELWIFGGVFPKPDPQPDGCDNELHIFSPVMEGWYKPIVTGEKPVPRSGHSANVVEDRLIVFGGWDFPFCFNDVHILDLTTLDWSAPKILGEPPKPRCWAASSTVTNNRVFIHGGYDGDNPLDDAFILNFDTCNWQKLTLDVGPSARAGHACIRLCSHYENQEEDEVIIFGGGDNDGNFFSDMLSFYIPYTPAVSF